MGLRATSRAGFEHMHVLALAYWQHHMHAARLFLAFIHGCPLRARSGQSTQVSFLPNSDITIIQFYVHSAAHH